MLCAHLKNISTQIEVACLPVIKFAGKLFAWICCVQFKMPRRQNREDVAPTKYCSYFLHFGDFQKPRATHMHFNSNKIPTFFKLAIPFTPGTKQSKETNKIMCLHGNMLIRSSRFRSKASTRKGLHFCRFRALDFNSEICFHCHAGKRNQSCATLQWTMTLRGITCRTMWN